MIYLVFKIGLYLLLALACGAGAGWLARNVSAAKQEDEQQRRLNDLNSKVPQLESLMRTRDDQLKTLRAQLKEKDTRIGRLRDELGALGKVLDATEAELKQAKAVQTPDAGADAAMDAATGQVAELSAEVARLRRELSDARVRAATSRSESDEGQRLRNELQSLEARMKQNGHEHDRMSKVLEQERRRVLELERERELQSKSLQLLHQQLEIERERAVDGG